jgi:hypothetical protein
MKRYQQIFISVFLLAAGLLVACDSQQSATAPPATAPPATLSQPTDAQMSAPEESTVTDYDGLVTGLEFIGASVEPAGTVSQPFFTPQGQVFSVDGQEVQVFEYEIAAGAEAALVAPDGGSVGTSMMMWMATPHFYKDGRLIVLYVGDESDVVDLLDTIFGSQFAGG